jgi:serine/threonine protein kinase/tetratricopeptide (TPR) repeat protein
MGATAPSSSSRSVSSAARDRAVLAVKQDRRRGVAPPIEKYWAECGSVRSPSDLAVLVKTDLQARFAQGERPAADEYLDRFPALKQAKDKVLSLVYEEFCLREERGEKPDPAKFCERYHPWRDSLASQLKYHQMLSSVVGNPATPPPQFPDPGEKFQSFQLQSILGRGSAGQVYLALDESLGEREVALKISPDRGGEHSIQGRLDHDHIVPVLSVTRQEDSGLRGLCMPYRPGFPLDEVIRRVAPGARPAKALALWEASAPDSAEASLKPSSWVGFPTDGSYAEGVAWVIAKLAAALAHAHAKGVYHRDVKPANVLMTPRGGPQLLDFNLAHAPHAAEAAEAALTGGTLPYMAPEQLEAFLDPDRWENVGAAADLYALGLLLREMLTGRRPDGPDPDLPLPRAIRDLMDRRLGPPPSLRTENPTVPHALDAIVGRCLARRPEERYATGSDLAEDLTRFIDHLPLKHAVNPSRREVVNNWARKHPRVFVGSLIAIALGAVSVDAIFWIRAHRSSGLAAWFGMAPPVDDASKTRTPEEQAATAALARNHGAELLKAGLYDAARREFEKAIESDADHPKAYDGLGSAQHNLKDFESSRKSYEKAIELWQLRSPRLEPAFRDAWTFYLADARRALAGTLNGLAHNATDGAELEKGEELFKQSLALLDLADPDLEQYADPRAGSKWNRSDALFGRGEIARVRGDRRQAADYFRQALEVLKGFRPTKPAHITNGEAAKERIRKKLEEVEAP